MPKAPHVFRRGTVWHFRRKVPTDLLAHYAPKREFTKSLRTSDHREAAERARLEAVRLDEEFNAVRAKADRVELDSRGIERLTRVFRHLLRAADDESRVYDLGDGRAVRIEAKRALESMGFPYHTRHTHDRRSYLPPTGSFVPESYRSLGPLPEKTTPSEDSPGLGDSPFDRFEQTAHLDPAGLVNAYLRTVGLTVEAESPEFKRLGEAIVREVQEALPILRERAKGRAADGGVDVEAPFRLESLPETPRLTFSATFDEWARDQKPETVEDFRPYVRRFVEVVGDMPVGAVTKAHVRRYRDAMRKMPKTMTNDLRRLPVPLIIERLEKKPDTPRLSARTVNMKALGAVGAVLSFAIRQGYRDEANPTSGLRVRDKGDVGGSPSRVPYALADLVSLFSSPVFADNVRPLGGGGEAAYWLPVLALYSGARLGELVPLEVADIRNSGGVWFMDIHGNGEGRSVKTAQSRRRVPLHPEVIRLGFLDFVGEVGAGRSSGRLWPSARKDPWGKWWGRYARGWVTDPAKVFHSFRHLVKRTLRNAGVEAVLRDAVMGHEAKDVAEKYGLDETGTGFDLRVLAEAVEKLRYPGLSIPPWRAG